MWRGGRWAAAQVLEELSSVCARVQDGIAASAFSQLPDFMAAAELLRRLDELRLQAQTAAAAAAAAASTASARA